MSIDLQEEPCFWKRPHQKIEVKSPVPMIRKQTMATQTNVFQNLEKVDPLTLQFQLTPTHVSYANTLRRAILTEVESLGFRSDIKENGSTSDVRVQENNTPMTNEMLADRVGLLPVWLPEGIPNPLAWDPDQYTFEINVESDKETSRDVTCDDFVVRQVSATSLEEGKLVPGKQFFHPDPITLSTSLIAVLKGKQPNQNPQRIKLSARATVGRGREHVRFCPVSQCSYRYTIDDNEEEQRKVFENWLRSTKKISDVKALDKEADRKEALMREFKTMEIERCYIKDPKTGEPNSFDFTIESKGVLSIPYIVSRALEAIEQKCRKYASIDKGDGIEGVQIQPADARMSGFDFIIPHEDHTLGNLLQTWMDQNLMDSKDITFAGYKIPHPLRDEMVFRIGVEDGLATTARAMFARAATECATMFKKWRENWDSVVKGELPTVKPKSAAKPRTRKVVASNLPALAAQQQSVVAPPPEAPITAEAAAPTASTKKPTKRDPRRGAFWTNPVVE